MIVFCRARKLYFTDEKCKMEANPFLVLLILTSEILWTIPLLLISPFDLPFVTFHTENNSWNKGKRELV